jgi:hypothetical protein
MAFLGAVVLRRTGPTCLPPAAASVLQMFESREVRLELATGISDLTITRRAGRDLESKCRPL